MAPRASRRVSTRQAESLRHDGDRCRHEWRHGTQDCVRHKSKKPRVIVVRLSSTRGAGKGRRSGQNDRPALRYGTARILFRIALESVTRALEVYDRSLHNLYGTLQVQSSDAF